MFFERLELRWENNNVNLDLNPSNTTRIYLLKLLYDNHCVSYSSDFKFCRVLNKLSITLCSCNYVTHDETDLAKS